MEKISIQTYAILTLEYFHIANKWIAEKAPWNLKGEEVATQKGIYLRTILEALFILNHFLLPLLPLTSEKIFSYFHRTPLKLKELSWKNLKSGDPLELCPILFERIYKTRWEDKNKDPNDQQTNKKDRTQLKTEGEGGEKKGKKKGKKEQTQPNTDTVENKTDQPNPEGDSQPVENKKKKKKKKKKAKKEGEPETKKDGENTPSTISDSNVNNTQ